MIDMTKERNEGIDLLRIVAMLLITMLHVIRHGGMLDGLSLFSSQYFVVWILYILTNCAVNCYALISGYVNKGGYWQLTKD